MKKQTIQILRGVKDLNPANSDTILLDGQPFYAKYNDKFYIGDGESPIKDLKGTQIGLNIQNSKGSGSLISSQNNTDDSEGVANVIIGQNNKIHAKTGAYNFVSGSNNELISQLELKDTANAGNAIFGLQNKVYTIGITSNTPSGQANIVGGRANIVKSSFTIVNGEANKVESVDSFVTGFNNEIKASEMPINDLQGVTVVGAHNKVLDNNYTTVLGRWLHSNLSSQLVVGMFNEDKENLLFSAANGKSDTKRSNAFEVYNDGRAKLYGEPKEDNDIVTKGYVDSNYAIQIDGQYVKVTNLDQAFFDGLFKP